VFERAAIVYSGGEGITMEPAVAMNLMASAAASFLVAFPAFLSIVNPAAGALIYHEVTASRSHAERTKLAWRVAAYSAIVMLTAFWAGATVMSFFGISIEALRVAGGLVVAARAWEMLSEPEENEGRKQEQAAPAAHAADVAFFPLTMPFTTGPGTISVAIALSASRPAEASGLVSFYGGVSVAAVLVALSVGLCYALADRLADLLGPARTRVMTRISDFLLLCIGVQILLTGVEGVLDAVSALR
jgi:multiple antibiotic resistance protein